MHARCGSLAAVLLAGAVLVPTGAADAAECRVVETTFKPADKLQIVVWLEDAAGNFVSTMYVTDAVGRRGIGNRPGRFDFNSGPLWPYGRRITTFPVWSHRHGETFPALVFQNDDDDNLSHPSTQSSDEYFFCRPLLSTEASWDTGTCASASVDTDKGRVDPGAVSLYPPREDIERRIEDSVAVDMFETMNTFDLVSGATPAADIPYTVTWPMPATLPPGDYVVWMEVSKEFDHNATYSEAAYPSPTAIPWLDFGEAYRGQPSVVYQVPFTLGAEAVSALSSAYAGYGDPDGLDGNVRVPDSTIDTAIPGSGAARLLLHTSGPDTFRVRVVSRPEMDDGLPGAATELAAEVDGRSARLTFVAPGEDGVLGMVSGYEIRLRAAEPITEENFADSPSIATTVDPDEPGQIQVVELDNLLPNTLYHVAVRAFDDCKNVGPITTVDFITPERPIGEVDACFVATAAYGSAMATEVSLLRGFRDGVLRQSVLGELFVESYYTVGPAFSSTIAHSDVLRQAARAELAPLIDLVRGLTDEP